MRRRGEQLRNGVPALSINHGSGTLTLQLPPKSTVSDRRWHRLDILSDGKVVQLILDQCGGVLVSEAEGEGGEMQEREETGCRAKGETPGHHRFLNVFQPLQLGGVKETSPHRRYRSFTGCIRNLVVDSQVYDLASPGESVDSTPGCRLTDGVCVTAAGPSCGPRASCLADWGSFSCECHPGYSGHKCDSALPEFSFDSGSVVRFQLRGGGSSRRTNVQLLLRTRASSGTLLSMTSREADEFIALEITEGLLSVRADLGDGVHALHLPGQRIDVGQWVLVGLVRHDNLFTLRLERGGGSREVQTRLGGRREVVVHSVTLGSGAGDEAGFQGCLRDVRFNAQPLPLDGQSRDMVTVLERGGVTPGCSSDACRGHPCRSPLICTDLWRRHQCRCPGGQVTVTEDSGQQRCATSPCAATSCRNGGVCQALSPDTLRCRCLDGFGGQRCELGGLKGHRLAALSPSSILAISMCLLVFFAVLVAVTVWNQKGSRNKFRKRGVYHIPAEHESWEDIRENILNYNEEGGGRAGPERIRHLGVEAPAVLQPVPVVLLHHRPAHQVLARIPGGALALPTSASRTTTTTTPPTTSTPPSTPPSPQRGRALTGTSRATWRGSSGRRTPTAGRCRRTPCTCGAWRARGRRQEASARWGQAASRRMFVCGAEEEEEEGGFVDERLSRWGPKFQALSEMYDRPQLALTYRDAVAYIQRSHSRDPLPHHH
ncbi:hypothetical protein PBY51_017129 [Eleginops maclovinus]|uniref:Uncharacterized protein n=1 Tax=Eleginops maclovinus TaxID=56733 RepID=A0AAN8ANM7_ELEMC|nr:hypothetical protein PBY51_017129 [Eleginops maclovinus]